MKTRVASSRLAKHLFGWAGANLHANPIILVYHGVSACPVLGPIQNWDAKHLPLDTFAGHLRMLKRWRHVVPLAEIIDGLRTGKNMRRWAAITFDDGYENNASHAAPVLADFKMCATFFLSSGYIGVDRWTWTDWLENIFASTREKSVMPPGFAQPLPLTSAMEKRAAITKIKTALKRMPHEHCKVSLEELAFQLGNVESTSPHGDYRFMSWDQARELSRGGFEIGAHTINHPILSKIPFPEARQEILGSRDRIVAELGKCSETFCYPNGHSSDYTAEHMALCREHFQAALSTNQGVADARHLYELQRFGTPRGRMAPYIEWMLFRGR